VLFLPLYLQESFKERRVEVFPFTVTVQIFSVAPVCVVIFVREEPTHHAEATARRERPEDREFHIVSDVGNISVLHLSAP
jgi:hypothetical protein